MGYCIMVTERKGYDGIRFYSASLENSDGSLLNRVATTREEAVRLAREAASAMADAILVAVRESKESER